MNEYFTRSGYDNEIIQRLDDSLVCTVDNIPCAFDCNQLILECYKMDQNIPTKRPADNERVERQERYPLITRLGEDNPRIRRAQDNDAMERL